MSFYCSFQLDTAVNCMYRHVFFLLCWKYFLFIKNPKTLYICTFILDFESQIFSVISDFWTHSIYSALSPEKHYRVPTCRWNTFVILLTCVITNVHGMVCPFLFLPGAYIVILIKRVKVRNFSTSALNFNICLLLIGVKNRSHYTHLTLGEIEFCH